MIPTPGIQEKIYLLQGQILGKQGGRLSENHPA